MEKNKITTENRKYTCPECQNENEIPADAKVGDVVECDYCGIEFEIVSSENGEFVLQIIEEEK